VSRMVQQDACRCHIEFGLIGDARHAGPSGR
jgi:hypothetical protein